MAADDGPFTGRQLANHLVGPRLGAGGMGEVYRARDLRLKREVAIKILASHLVDDPERQARFRREAELLAALNHPNITTIHDIAEQGGLHFIVMELVLGRRLDECIGRDGMALNVALRYASQIADAVSRAHAAGIVHRDLKPANIMVTDDGRVKVLDFGVAKLTGHAERDALAAATVTAGPQTVAGSIVGTVSYMSPEQAQGQAVDARSDIFSFGAVLYEMLSGRRAFKSDRQDPVSTLALILHKEPPPLPDPVPADLQKLVNRCLRKDPERRPQLMKEVKIALDELIEESGTGRLAVAQARPRGWSRRWSGWLAGASVLAAGGLLWTALDSGGRDDMHVPVPLTTYPGYEREAAFSPDGSQIAFVWDGDREENRDIYIQLVGGGRPLRLTTDPAADFSPSWSPDGRTIAFLRKLPGDRAAVLLIPALGGPERRLTDVAAPEFWMAGPYVAWTPDSGSLAVVDRAFGTNAHAIYLLSVEGGERQPLTVPSAAAYSDSDPAFSPDGRHLAFARASGTSDVWMLPLTSAYTPSGDPRPLTFGSWWAGSPAWADRRRRSIWPGPGDVVFASRERPLLLRVRGSGGPAHRFVYGTEEASHPAISLRARRLVYTKSTTVISFARVDGLTGAITPLIGSSRQDSNAQLSPDGRRIVFQSTRSGASEIWVSGADGSDPAKITSMEAPMTGTPVWSPDGSRIGFDSNKEGQFELYSVSADGGRPERLTQHPAFDGAMTYSRDGRWVYFGSNRSGEFQIWKQPVHGGDAVQITRRGGFICQESADGRWLYYLPTLGANAELRKVPVDGGEESKVLDAVIQRAFAVTETGVFYLAEDARPADRAHTEAPSSVVALRFLSFGTGQTRQVASVGRAGLGLSAFPGGRDVLYSQLVREGSDLMLVEGFR